MDSNFTVELNACPPYNPGFLLLGIDILKIVRTSTMEDVTNKLWCIHMMK